MQKRTVIPAIEIQPTTKFVGVALPLDIHQALRIEAAKEGTSASQLYRKAIVQYLGKVKR